jgi:coenzyme F420-reducing hydrogenase beta subunit
MLANCLSEVMRLLVKFLSQNLDGEGLERIQAAWFEGVKHLFHQQFIHTQRTAESLAPFVLACHRCCPYCSHLLDSSVGGAAAAEQHDWAV